MNKTSEMSLKVGCFCEEVKVAISENDVNKFTTHVLTGIIVGDIGPEMIEFKPFKDLVTVMIGVGHGITPAEKACSLIETIEHAVSMLLVLSEDALDMDPESPSFINMEKLEPIFDASVKEAKHKRLDSIINLLLHNPIEIDEEANKDNE